MIDSKYSPKDLEIKWYKTWEENNYFTPKNNKDAKSYSIAIPPPNVTGSLHMGHALQDSIMDTLIRYHRMKGYNTLWQMGTDHAGIATQMVVERQLAKDNVSRHDLGREKFIEKIWEWKEHSGGKITKQLRRLGASVDWSRERFTMDEGLSKAVHEVFIRLYDEGLIYRGKRLVNWDPILHTAVSDLEVESVEEKGKLWHIIYPIKDSKETLTVATTRPETMLGDSAVAVNPNDERYQHLIGKMILLPITNREIPIVADEYVDKEFGTGCVKITPAHDFNDYEVGKRHDLPLINIFTIDAKCNENCPLEYQGLDRFLAREKVLKDLESLNLIDKIDDHILMVPRGDRTNTVIEPYLTDQWFVKIESLAKPAIEAVENGNIKFVPENWSKTYFEWMRNIQDWCISRQLWWGHRIPAWYDNDGNIYVGNSLEHVREKYSLDDSIELRQDEDVLDTWFSSALWPFSTLGWPEKTPLFDEFYPTNVLVTGFDIIFFWVARMIMFGIKFTGEIPFDTVYIHGLIQDHFGQKMSKTKGNVIDPLDLIDGIDLESLVKKRTSGLMQPQMEKQVEKATRKEYPEGIPAFGTDALRFTFCSLATTGRHIRFDLTKIESIRNFCNKIWNAARYVLINTDGKDLGINQNHKYSLSDRWISSIWQDTKSEFIRHIEQYRFDLACQVIYEFTWNEFCDWYLELSKPVLTGTNKDEAQSIATRNNLVTILEEILLVLHPIMPFITEEIWQIIAPMLKRSGKTIMLEKFPEVEDDKRDISAVENINWLKNIIISIRNIRGEMNISPKKQIPLLLQKGNSKDKILEKENHELLKSLANLESIAWLKTDAIAPLSATAINGELEIYIPMQGLIDFEAEAKRLEKEIQKLSKEYTSSKNRLDNQGYISKAPKDVVEKEKVKVLELNSQIQKLEKHLDNISKSLS